MIEGLVGKELYVVELQFPFPYNNGPRLYPAFGIWERTDGDNNVEVYIPGHREGLKAAFYANFSQNPDGIDQTQLVLERGQAQIISTFVA